MTFEYRFNYHGPSAKSYNRMIAYLEQQHGRCTFEILDEEIAKYGGVMYYPRPCIIFKREEDYACWLLRWS